mgnify:CR=1 FL=1
MKPLEFLVNMAYCVVQIDLENGRRMEYPRQFSTAEEAMNMIYELSEVDMKVTYIVKMVPQVQVPGSKAEAGVVLA